LRALKNEFPAAHRYIADYTGGSKSMGVGLAVAALESGWELSLVRGQRPDLVQVADGTEMAGLVNSWEVRARQRMDEARRLFDAYAYTSAGELLAGLLRQAPLSPEIERTIRKWVALCRGFDAWDRFDHATAAHVLGTIQSQIVPQWIFLKKLTGHTRSTGYEPVLDLVRNAERRAARGRFDDAVARLYRAIELLAQTRLNQREPPLNSSNLDIERLPEALWPPYKQMREINEMRGWGPEVKLGLMDDYILLVDLDDPLGKVFAPMQNRLRKVLKRRNLSILAHGGEPLDRVGYEDMYSIALMLINEGLTSLKIRASAPQFPLLGADGIHQREED
jgi:CRISPR-associated protein (TIGR02710 family)